MRGDVQKQVGDQLNGITESAFFFFFHSKECAATGNSRAHIMSASSKGIDRQGITERREGRVLFHPQLMTSNPNKMQ